MPRLSKWLADGTEKVFSSMIHDTEVTSVKYLTQNLKQVQFSGDLDTTKFTPGQVIEFRINDNDFRHYTPSYYDRSAGICEVVFFLHGKGVGSHWAENLKVGDRTRLMGPGGKLKFQEAEPYQFFFGDESSLGLYKYLSSITNAANQNYLCLLELNQAHASWPHLLGIEAEVVAPLGHLPSNSSNAWLENLPPKVWDLWKNGCFYLTGRAASLKSFRKALLAKGLRSRQIKTQAYWADHKKGL